MTRRPGLTAETPPPAAAAHSQTPSAAAPWHVLTSGDDPPLRPPVRSRRLLLQLGAAALLVIVLVALAGAAATRRLAENEAVSEAGRRADLIAEAVLQPVLSDGLLTGDATALAELDRVVRAQVVGRYVVRVKIWTADGRIVYSDDPRLIGQTFPLDEEEVETMANHRTRAAVSDLTHAENRYERGKGKFLEVYRPVQTSPGGTMLLFETYSPYGEVTLRSSQLWRGFFGLLLTSLGLLIVLLIPLLWRLLDAVSKAQAGRETLLQRAVDASHTERRRIAGTLHDGVVQELAATSFALAGCSERAEREGSTHLARDLRECARTVRTSIGGLRSLLVDIYPPNLSSAGLAATLTDLVGPLRSRDVTVDLELPAHAAPIDAEVARVAYRIAHECVTNVAQHAGARTLRVRLDHDSTVLGLDVQDDGVGFDVASVMAAAPDGHLGLHVMTDLARRAGATLAVSSGPGQGTWWQLRMPNP